jgi:peptide/nickel transport system permease protein
MVIGVAFGLAAGYYDRLQTIIMRAMDVMLTFPGLIVALTVIAVLGPGVNNVMIAIAVSQIPQFARLVNGSVLSLREQLFVEAAQATGETDGAMLFRYILPNAFAPIMVQASLLIPSSIMVAASLSFLGLGVQPPTPEWGAMINLGREWMRTDPHLIFFPGVALMIVVLGFNLFGDGLRDALDPKLQQG